MPNPLLTDLGQLTGEEIYHLVNMLDRHQVRCVEIATQQLAAGQVDEGITGLVLDLIELRQDTLMQVARITLPLLEAQAIIYRVRYLRQGAVPMTADAAARGGS